MKVAVILLDGCEDMEALVPIDILRRASVDIETLSITDSLIVESARGVKIHSDKLIETVKLNDYDMLVLPGGPGTKNYWKSEKLSKYLKSINESEKKVAAICAAPTYLSYLGILRNKNVTCFPDCKEELLSYDESIVYSTRDVITDGNIITSKAAGTSIDFALELVNNLCGKEKSEQIRKQICYRD